MRTLRLNPLWLVFSSSSVSWSLGPASTQGQGTYLLTELKVNAALVAWTGPGASKRRHSRSFKRVDIDIGVPWRRPVTNGDGAIVLCGIGSVLCAGVSECSGEQPNP